MQDKDEKLISLSGSPIYHHWEPAPGLHPPERHGRFLCDISTHIETHLGPIGLVFHEIVSKYVHIDVHWIPPNHRRHCHTFVTSGMSDTEMSLPVGVDAPALAELHMTLPPSWQLGREALKDEANFWPLRLLKSLARFPFLHRTWLGYGHTVPNGDPAVPYDASTRLCCALVVLSPSVPEDFRVLRARSGEEITFYSVVPIHEDEMDYKLRQGVEALVDRFHAEGVSDLVDPVRQSVCRGETGGRFSQRLPFRQGPRSRRGLARVDHESLQRHRGAELAL